MLANPIGLIIIALIALAAIFVILWKKSETFRNIMTAAWNGIKTAALAVFNFLKTYFLTMFTLYKTIFTKAIAGLKAAWSKIGEFLTKVKEVFGKVLSYIGSIPGKLLGLGKAIINGLIDGIKWGIEKLKGIFKWITDNIPDWKGPASKDKVLLRDSGQLIMQGLNTGIESQIPALEKTLGGVTDTIAGTSADMNASVTATGHR